MIFRRIDITHFAITILISHGLVAASVMAADDSNYSLGNSTPVDSRDGLNETTPQDDFPSEESQSLFGNDVKEDALSTKNIGKGSGRVEPVPSNAKTKVIPKAVAPKNTPTPVKQEPAPQSVQANMRPIATPAPLPSQSLPLAVPAAVPVAAGIAQPASNTVPQAPVNIAPPIATPAPLPVQPAAPIMQQPVVQPPIVQAVEKQPVQNFVAPLTTDGGVAPIKRLEPMPGGDFAGAPPLPGSRRNLARGQAPESYKVEVGDTLYDVCSQLIDDGNYWPRLWSLNPDIKNPHFIYPGMSIAFYPGDPTNPPFVEVVAEEEMIPVDKGPIKEKELIAQDIEIPQARTNLTMVEDKIDVVGPTDISTDEVANFFEVVGAQYTSDEVILTLPAFYYQNEIEGLGTIDSGYYGEVISGDGVKLRVVDAKDLTNGLIYSVLRYRGPVENPNSGEFVGYRYDFTGNLRVNSKRADGIYEASVSSSRIGLRPGDIVVPFLSTRRPVQNWHRRGQGGIANATIVGMTIHTQTFGGEGAIVFLDKGALSPGNFYSVFQKNRFSGMPGVPLTDLDDGSRNVGLLRIVDSNDKTSVAVVVKNDGAIRVGDRLTMQAQE